MNAIAGNMVIDVIRYEKDYYIHKQVEKRNGLIFVRLKKKSIIDNT